MPGAGLAEAVLHDRGPRQQGLAMLGLAVQDPQRVDYQAAPAVVAPALLRGQIELQLGLEVRGALGAAQGVDQQAHLREPQFGQEVHQHQDDLGVQFRGVAPQGLAVDLMKLAIAPFLGPFVAEHGAHEVNLFSPRPGASIRFPGRPGAPGRWPPASGSGNPRFGR
jgi:hypothetical protein